MNNHERCKTCKYWTRYDVGTDDAKYYGKHAGTCGNDKFVYESAGSRGNTTLKDGLLYWDFEGYMAEFNTGEDFGCIHWEQSK